MDAILTVDPTIAALNLKVDRLTEQVTFMAAEMRRQQRRREEWDELKADVTPIFNDLFRMAVEQLEELDGHVQLEDILRLFKRLLRNVRTLEQMLDQLESILELAQDAGPLGHDAFRVLVNRLDEMERKGYFAFAQGGLEIVDNIVTSFTEEDVRQLGDNIVLILQTIKEMTQPEIMHLLRTTVHVAKEEEPGETSLLSIVRQLNDPAVKRGLARTLNVLRSVSDIQKN